MRFSRDRRGYENTFVVQGERRRGKGRPRVLYWFRTPPGVKVGRAALDEEAIRLLEEFNPQVEFDWTRILKGEGPVEEPRQASVEQPRRSTDRLRRQEGRRRGERRADQPATPAPHSSVRAAATPALDADLARAPDPGVDVTEQGSPGEPPALADTRPTAVLARLGSEGVSRLRARYAEILTRISERVPDEPRRGELKSVAERLNPDSWVTDAEVAGGLENYEGVFESLRAVVGRRKRRRRRGARKEGPGAEGPAEVAASASGLDSAPQDDSPGSEDDLDAEDL